MYKIIKNVQKVRFRRDQFETCNIWVKRKGLSVVITFFPSGLSAPEKKTKKKNKKQQQQQQKTTQNKQKQTLTHTHIKNGKNWVDIYTLGLYTCEKKNFKKKNKKYIPGPGAR